MRGSSTPARGVASSLAASALFGLIFYLAGVVDAEPDAVFSWRMVVTAASFGLMLLSPTWRRALGELWSHVRTTWWMPVALVFSASMVGVQMWLFAWTPVHGHALDASLGYLLLPVALVLTGRLVFGEPVTRLQWLAVLIAVAAVVVKLVATATISWVTLAVCAGYASYFAVRKRAGLDLAATFGAEVLVIAPVAVVLVLVTPGGPAAGLDPAVMVAGAAGAAAMWAYVAASRLLSMPVFGLLTYVEPVLMFVVALALGESLHAVDAVVYGLLAIALAVLAVGGFRRSSATGRHLADIVEVEDLRLAPVD